MKCNIVFFAMCASVILTAVSVNAQDSDRLVGWWKMDEATNATVLADSSGYGRNATLGTGTSIIDGRFGKAVLFDGTSDAGPGSSIHQHSPISPSLPGLR